VALDATITNIRCVRRLVDGASAGTARLGASLVLLLLSPQVRVQARTEKGATVLKDKGRNGD